MAGNKKISQLVDGGAGQSGDNFVIERGGVNFKLDFDVLDPGGISINGTANDMIVVDEKVDVALEKRQVLPSPISFVDNTAVPPTEVNGDIYLLDDTGASDAAWDGNVANSWVRFDGTAGLWKGFTPVDGYICTIQDTGDARYFKPTTSAWELLGSTPPAGANTEIQFNNLGAFGASSLFTFSTAFGQFRCDADTVFNDSGTDQNFRIEGLSNPNMFFVDAGNDRIAIGHATPLATLHIERADGGDPDFFRLQSTDQTVDMRVQGGNNTAGGGIFALGVYTVAGTQVSLLDMGRDATTADGRFSFHTRVNGGSLTRKMVIQGSGNIGMGENFTAPGAILEIRGPDDSANFAFIVSNDSQDIITSKHNGEVRIGRDTQALIISSNINNYVTYSATSNSDNVTDTCLKLREIMTLTANRTQETAGALTLAPGYGATFTVDVHKYILFDQPTFATGAAVTDAAALSFDAAAGTHRAVGNVDKTGNAFLATIKVDIDGTLGFVDVRVV